MSQSGIAPKRAGGRNRNGHYRHHPNNRRDEGENTGRSNGANQKFLNIRKTGLNSHGRGGGTSGMHRVNNWNDQHAVAKSKKDATSDQKNYEHLFIVSPGRKDHVGIKFKGDITECDICCRESDIFALGSCFHPICIECGIRLRVLCKNETCPKCRATINTLYFVQFPGDWNDYELPNDFVEHGTAAEENIKLADAHIAQCYDTYLSHPCLICAKKGDKRVFQKFAQLDQHMFMVHRFEFCAICVENLTLFTFERRFYSHVDLERHMRLGDSDDKSMKGHPQCLFCEKRFLDEEFRYKHLRKEHFFCQICDSDGNSNYFFPEHQDLLNHYKAKHIICQENECLQLGIAFRTDTELKLHKSRDHAAGPQTLNLDIHFLSRNTLGSSRGNSTAVGPSRISQRNVPRINVVSSEQRPLENRTSNIDDVTIVPSAQTEQVAVDLHYRGPRFSLQGSDFPRLGRSVRPTGTFDTIELQQKNKNTSVSAANGLVSASNSSNSNSAVAASSNSNWFIDDDEQFPPHKSSMEQQTVRVTQPEICKEHENEINSKLSAVGSSWSRALKGPQSLSNVATAFAQNGFPSLPSSTASKACSNLPPGSVWVKKNRSVMEAPQNHHVTSSVHSTANNIGKKKILPKPDLWPRESVPGSWEERDDSPTEVVPPKITLKDVASVKDTSNKKISKKNKNKQKVNLSEKKDDKSVKEQRKNEQKAEASDAGVDPFPPLYSAANNTETEASARTDTFPSFSKLLSSTFSSVFGNNSANIDQKPSADTSIATSVNMDSSSFATLSKLKQMPENGLSERTSLMTEQSSVPISSSFSSNPLFWKPPPGFGPPPGFDNLSNNLIASNSSKSTAAENSLEISTLKIDCNNEKSNSDVKQCNID